MPSLESLTYWKTLLQLLLLAMLVFLIIREARKVSGAATWLVAQGAGG